MNISYTETAYIESARQGDTTTLSLFLKAGMNPEAKTYDGQSALLVATLANQADAVKLLLAIGQPSLCNARRWLARFASP